MTNEAYTLMETNRDRAIVRRSARYKKGGSKSKKCTLGHEYKSKKELDKMNGECVTWKLTKFYTWDEFKQMPDDIQVEYLNFLMDTYNVGIATITREVLGISRATLKKHVLTHGYENKLRERPRGGGVSTKKVEWFRQLVAEERTHQTSEEPKVEACDDIPEPIMRGIEKATESEPTEISKYEPSEQPFQYVNAMEFSTEYISDRIDHEMLYSVEHMFRGKKLKVSFTITAV